MAFGNTSLWLAVPVAWYYRYTNLCGELLLLAKVASSDEVMVGRSALLIWSLTGVLYQGIAGLGIFMLVLARGCRSRCI